MDILLAVTGLVILIIAGDVLVRGAVAISLRLGVPALIVSLTIVAFGTSAPELLIAVQAAIDDSPGLAFGNVIGSNTANVLLVLGVPAVISSIDLSGTKTRSSYLQMIGATVVFIILMFMGPMYIWHGLVLLTLFAGLMVYAITKARRARNVPLEELDGIDEDVTQLPAWRAAVYLVAGIIGLPIGANLLVDAAHALALEFGVSDEVIGLTLVAVGTSLPELATTVMAGIRRQADVALGNVIGSNLLNIVVIMGVASFFGPLAVDQHLLRVDVWVMLAASLVLAPFAIRRWTLSRPVGFAFLGTYTIYMVTLF